MWGANESSTVRRATLDSQGKESDCCRHGARDKYRKDGGDGVPGPEQDNKNETGSEYRNGIRSEVRFSYEDLAQPQLWTDKEGNKNRKVFKIT